MDTRTYGTVVNRQEADALKEMIFKRAKERAEALSTEAQDTYTSSVKNDVMELARNSFVANKNPFSIDTFNKKQNDEIVKEEATTHPLESQGLGFEKRVVENIKSQISFTNKLANEHAVKSTVNETMSDARKDFSSKSNFIGALEFLNSQATVALVRSKGKSFDAIA